MNDSSLRFGSTSFLAEVQIHNLAFISLFTIIKDNKVLIAYRVKNVADGTSVSSLYDSSIALDLVS